MSYQVKTHHVELNEGRHYIVLHDPETGAEHHTVIYLGHDVCPTCGHVQPKDNGKLDLKAIIQEEIANLEKSKQQVRGWARAHNVPVKR
jgi:hypothetical protein